MIYGPPRIGKSVFCSQIPDSVFLATEKGLDDLEVFRVDIRSWEELLGACRSLAAGGHQFKNVIIDTLDMAYVYCSDWICRKFSIDHESDLAQGKGWALVRSEFRRVLSKLSQLYGLYMVSHSTTREQDTPAGKITIIEPSIPGKAGDVPIDLADVILFFDIEIAKGATGAPEERRVVRTRRTKYYAAGCRGSSPLPATIEMNWKALSDAYSSRYKQAEPAKKEPKLPVAKKGA